MQPGRYDFTFRRGDYTALSVVPKTRNVFSQEVASAWRTGDVAAWQAGSLPAKTTANGGLVRDEKTGRISWVLTDADHAAFPAVAVPYTFKITGQDGRTRTYLAGTMQAEG